MNATQHHSAAAGNPELISVVAAAIKAAGGRIPFARYMELALYEPGLGYYATRPAIGKHGDFFTSVSVGPLFGRILARQLLRYRDQLGTPSGFRVIEYGGHRGLLRQDIVGAAPDLDYTLVEAGETGPDRITGCILSNELLDAFPVHRVCVIAGHWQELYVTDRPGGQVPFTTMPGPLSSPELAERLEGLPTPLMEGYTTEINLRATAWIAEMARRLDRGYVITIDYGYERDGYFAPHRRDGTLMCHYHHTANADPFARIGQQDITSHVEFTSFIQAGQRAGLEPILFADQSTFLLEAGHSLIEDIVVRDAGRWSPERNQLHQLLHPTLMGRTFKVLIQRKS